MEETVKKGNGLGVAGFILGILAAIFCWCPILNWILAILAVVFGLIGCFGAKKLKGLAIAGVILGIAAICFYKFYIVPTAVGALTDALGGSGLADSLNQAFEAIKDAIPAE